jgi:integrase/recombinase XerD
MEAVMASATRPSDIEVGRISGEDHEFLPKEFQKGPLDKELALQGPDPHNPKPSFSSTQPDQYSAAFARGDNLDERRKKLFLFQKKLTETDFPGTEEACMYLRHLYRRNCKIKTLGGNGTHIRMFLGFVKSIGRRSLIEITRRDIEAYAEFGQDQGYKPATVKNKLGSVYAFCNYLVRENIMPAEVVARKIRIKVPDQLPKAMEPEDVRNLLSAIETPRDRAIIFVLLRTGMRIGELLQTQVRDVLFEDRKITIYEGEKNQAGRVVYLSEDALEALLAWMRVRDHEKVLLFYAQGRQSMCYSTARDIFFAGLKKAGLEHKGYHLHCLRHTFASELLNAGMRLEVLQQLLGHTSLEVTRRYARLTDRTREEEYFRAMTIIQRGEINGHYRLDH